MEVLGETNGGLPRMSEEFLLTYRAFCDWAEEEGHPLLSGLRLMTGKWPTKSVEKRGCWIWWLDGRAVTDLPPAIYASLSGHETDSGIFKRYSSLSRTIEDAAKAYELEGNPR